MMKQKQKRHASPIGSVYGDVDDAARNPLSSSCDEEPFRRVRRDRRQPSSSDDFRVKILEFEGKLDPDEFLEWMYTIECIFKYTKVL